MRSPAAHDHNTRRFGPKFAGVEAACLIAESLAAGGRTTYFSVFARNV
jgi:hypothetical protein